MFGTEAAQAFSLDQKWRVTLRSESLGSGPQHPLSYGQESLPRISPREISRLVTLVVWSFFFVWG